MASASQPLEKVAGGFQFTEGPVWIAARSELIFSDIPPNKLYRLSHDRVSVFRDPSGHANGNALDPQGRLLTCEHGHRRVSRTEPDGRLVTLADRYEGKRLNSPNDLVCRRDGTIYFTDPPYGVKPEQRELDFQGVYRIAQDQLTLLARDFAKPNGLCFSPEETLLYIADTERSHIRVFTVTGAGTLANGRLFCEVARPDGLRVDPTGNLWVAAETGVEVFDVTGRRLAHMDVPERPANLCFGGANADTLYITARTSLYRARLSMLEIPTQGRP